MRLYTLLLIITSISIPLTGNAANTPEAAMANMLMQMNHRPSAAETQQLSAYINDASQPESVRAVAQAISNIDHRASDADKSRLKQVLADDSASDAIKSLAKTVMSFNHQASSAERVLLMKFAGN